MALAAGGSLEVVQKATGHNTTDIVLKHYFQPGREDFRQALQSPMPKLLTRPSPGSGAGSGEKSTRDEMKTILDGLTAKIWKKSKVSISVFDHPPRFPWKRPVLPTSYTSVTSIFHT